MKAWALLKEGRVSRITLSQDLAEEIAALRQIQPVEVQASRKLKPGEPSPTGAYALVCGRKKKILRVTLDHDTAQLFHQGSSRYLAEATYSP